MVITENDPFLRQLPKRRRVFLAHEIRPHPVPNDNNHVSLCPRFLIGEAARRTRQSDCDRKRNRESA